MAEEIMEEVLEEEDTQKGKFMTFQTGNEYYGISISYVNEIIVMQPITAIPEAEDYIKGLLNLRGKIIPVIDVRVRFKMDQTDYTDRTCIIVINVKSNTIGLIVEQIAEVDTIMDSDIMPPTTLGHKGKEQNKYVYGLARTGNTVKLLLDPERLIGTDTLAALGEDVQEEDQE